MQIIIAIIEIDIQKNKKKFVLFYHYIYNILIISADIQKINDLKRQLLKKFEMKYLRSQKNS